MANFYSFTVSSTVINEMTERSMLRPLMNIVSPDAEVPRVPKLPIVW